MHNIVHKVLINIFSVRTLKTSWAGKRRFVLFKSGGIYIFTNVILIYRCLWFFNVLIWKFETPFRDTQILGFRLWTLIGFYILLTVHRVMIICKWPTWRTILYLVFIFIFNSLHVSSTSCSSSGETNCVNTTSGYCHSLSVTMSSTGRKWTSDLHTTRAPTQSDSYHR